MWPHPANLVQFDSPVAQRGIGNELCELFIVDRQDLRNNKRRRFTDFSEQILNLPDSGEISVIRAVLRKLQRRVVIDPFDFQLERLFKLKHFGKRFCGFPHSTFPVVKLWIPPLKPGKIFLPLAHVGKKMCEIPFVGLGNFSASWYLR